MTAKKGDHWNITEPQGVSSARKRCSCSFTNADFDSHIVEDKIFLIESSISKNLI